MLGHRSFHEDEDDALGFGRQHRGLREQRLLHRGRCLGLQRILAKQAGKGKIAKPRTAGAKHRTAGKLGRLRRTKHGNWDWGSLLNGWRHFR